MDPSLLPPPPTSWPPPVEDRSERRARGIGNGAMTLVGLGGVLLAARTVSLHAPPCPMRTVTGIPCPGCGMTRLADAVAHGHLSRALHVDPAGVALLAGMAIVAVYYLVQVVIRRTAPPAW